MSWDVMLFRFDQHYVAMNDVPKDAHLVSMGTQTSVRSVIDHVFQATTWAEPQEWGVWGFWDDAGGSIQFNIGNDEQRVETVALHVRAEDQVVVGILTLAEDLEAQAVDCSSSEFLTASDADPARGLRSWREYRDRVVAQYS